MQISLLRIQFEMETNNALRYTTRITAIAVLTVFGLSLIVLSFVRSNMLQIYQNLAGTYTALPSPTAICLKATQPLALWGFCAIMLIFFGISESAVYREHVRFMLQLTFALSWALFLVYCMWAFILPM